jgi:peptidoglycan/xylan/chitin deacetylase (PgdA/CDA1 family)
MYHRVLPQNLVTTNLEPGMYVTTNTFEMHLNYLSKNFNIISFSDMIEHGSNPNIHRNNRPSCLITFDDGWIDFYQYAFPLLKKFKLKSTVYLPTNYIGSKKRFWTDRLIDIFIRLSKKKYSIQPQRPSSIELINEIEIFDHNIIRKIDFFISKFKKHSLSEIENIMYELCNRWGIKLLNDDPVFMNWQQVKELSKTGLVEFGSHTSSHQLLVTLSKDKIQDEIKESKKILIEKKIIENESSAHFCYPNGSYNKYIAEMVKYEGYSSAVTTKKGWNNFGDNSYTLKRIGIHDDISNSLSLFACRISNLF